MENLNVKLEKAEGELIVRTGAAKVIKDPKQVLFTGTFQAVINFWEKRKLNVVLPFINVSRLEYSKTDMRIKLIINEQVDYQDIIEGGMLMNPDLTSFGINKESTWTLEGLHKQVKLKRHLFHSQEEYAELLRKLVTQKAKIETDLNKDHDNRGNKSSSFSKKVDTDLPTSFTLILAPYKGYKTLQFPVEIYVQAAGDGLLIQLFSPELVVDLLTLQEEIFSETLTHFEEIPLMEK